MVIPETIEARYPYNETGQFARSWDANVYEPLIMMNALAAATSRVRIGVSVLVIPYRHPALTAKMLATADLLSHGRIILGAGVGWMQDEFDALGLPPGHYEHRGSVTTEYVKAIKEMWTSTGPSSFVGEYVGFIDAGTFPKPFQKPHPPIIIGGKGHGAMLRAVRWGDGFHAIAASPEQLAEEDRRDTSELEVSMLGPIRLTERSIQGTDRPVLNGSPEQIVEDLRRYGKAGLEHILGTPTLDGEADPLKATIRGMEFMAQEVLPLFR